MFSKIILNPRLGRNSLFASNFFKALMNGKDYVNVNTLSKDKIQLE